jgi:hypothetical protein
MTGCSDWQYSVMLLDVGWSDGFWDSGVEPISPKFESQMEDANKR